MTFKWIPRGKGKSPKNVRTDEAHLSKEEITIRADHAYHLGINTIPEMSEWSHFNSLFGSLKS
jgi:hypothetical protein